MLTVKHNSMKTKSIAIILLLFSVSFSYGQKYDPRLQKNHGDTIATIFSNNHNYYNFLIFELDYSYEIKPKSEVSGKTLKASAFKNGQGKTLTKEDIVKGQFNFKEWGITLKQDAPVIIALDDQSVLYFYDKVSNNIRFGKSPLYTK